MHSLEQAKSWLRDRVDDGESCPLCTQFAKVYRRKITSHTARILIEMYRKGRNDWVNLPQLGLGHADEAKARYWNLIEEYPDALRADGSGRSGWWKLTPNGVAFVRGSFQIPKYARIYNGKLLGLDHTETISIEDALGINFNYRELMQGI